MSEPMSLGELLRAGRHAMPVYAERKRLRVIPPKPPTLRPDWRERRDRRRAKR